uniref:p0648C09.18 protein n=1 Tax=Oryza sativa subsp. japonica TaxID=39947 RepID=Q8RYY2_ORYSJ|nr:P0648C09.18 [Oryza sativa Japonica Group]
MDGSTDAGWSQPLLLQPPRRRGGGRRERDSECVRSQPARQGMIRSEPNSCAFEAQYQPNSSDDVTRPVRMRSALTVTAYASGAPRGAAQTNQVHVLPASRLLHVAPAVDWRPTRNRRPIRCHPPVRHRGGVDNNESETRCIVVGCPLPVVYDEQALNRGGFINTTTWTLPALSRKAGLCNSRKLEYKSGLQLAPYHKRVPVGTPPQPSMGADERLKCIVIRISAGTAAAAARVVVKSSGQELKKRNTRAAFNSAVRPLGSAAAAPPRIHPLRPRDSVALLAGSRADLVRYDACTVVGATRLHGRAGSPTTTRARAPARSSAGTGTETRLARTRAGGMRVPGAPARTDAETQHFVPGFGT